MQIRGSGLTALGNIGERFGMDLLSVRRMRSVWQVKDADGNFYVLKPFRRGVSSMKSAVHVHETVSARSPLLLPTLKCSVQGKPFIFYQGCPILLTDWVAGRTLDYFSHADRLRALKTIRCWQEAVRGAHVPLSLRFWSRWSQVLEERIQEMQRCRWMAENRDSEFGRLYIKRWDFFYKQANLALQQLCSDSCQESAAESGRIGEICHNDWAHHNLILRPGGTVTVLDLEYLQGNAGLLDYVDLLNRFLLLDGGNPSVISVFLNQLSRLKALSIVEKEHLQALFRWPEAFWMAGRQYYIERLHYGERFSIQKFRRKVPDPDVWQSWQREMRVSLWG